jgi:signal transduction histidine kinase
VQRILGIISRMNEASCAGMALRGQTEVAARALVDLFPKSFVAVFERYPGDSQAHLIGGANLPPAWRARSVQLHDVPLLDEALQYPERVIERTKHRLRRGTAADVGDIGGVANMEIDGRLQTICAAIPESGGSRYALMFVAPPAPNDTPVREAAIEITRRLLAASAATGESDRALMLAAIHRAKLEWEHTADALPEIVGLLDARRRVVRISRAVERWQLGTVRSAIGHDLHSVLHPSCPGLDCALGASLELATIESSRTSKACFEIADSVLKLDLAVVLNAGAGDAGDTGGGGEDLRERWPQMVFIVANVSSLRSAERELKLLNHTLEQRVESRTRELLDANRTLRGEVERRREAETSLRRSTRDLEALSERLMNAQEAERKRISQDMHDSVGQTLSAIKYSLERAQLLSRREAPDEASGVIEVAIGRVQRLMEEVRTISMNLRPALLDHLGAASAVRGLCRDWQDVYRGVEVETDIAVEDAAIPPILVTNVFRAVQESLNNVARHAAAQHVHVSMRITAGVLTVAVRDDGAGFTIDDESSPTAGTRGLRGLHERAARTGGRCEVSSAPGLGTTVQLEWPVAAGQAAQLANARLN